jgi:hypothetical protein
VKQLKPDIAHIGHVNHLSTGLIDELNKLKIPIVYTLHDFWLMCPRGQFLTRSIGNTNNFQLCEKQDDKKCATDCYKVYFSGREENETTDIENWSSWIHQRMIETKQSSTKLICLSHLQIICVIDLSMTLVFPKTKSFILDYGFPTEYLNANRKIKRENKLHFWLHRNSHSQQKE